MQTPHLTRNPSQGYTPVVLCQPQRVSGCRDAHDALAKLQRVATIRELDAVTIGQIAAGEIIERPASVVKELVENSVDAGATRITVNIERGGIESIEVVDDGAGMEADELGLSLRRHATSKLRAAAELESIATLGFRGEGLASIAAVSQVEMLSRPAHADVGARVTASGERIGNVEPFAAPVGTRVRAVRLFEELPVRREYLAFCRSRV